MAQKPLLEPKNVDIVTGSGATKTFIISKFPAIAGRRIIAKYPLSAMPKIGDYEVNQETMLEAMSYVAVPVEGAEPLRLSDANMVDNHIPDWETLAKLELALMEYNCSFFANGAIQSFIEVLVSKAAPILSQIVTSSVQVLSKMETQLGSNSESN